MHEVVHVRMQGFTVTPDASRTCVLQLRNEVMIIFTHAVSCSVITPRYCAREYVIGCGVVVVVDTKMG